MGLELIDDKPWYHKGLKFKCTQCGACCTGEPGYVWLDEDDIDRLSKELKLERREFLEKYTRKAWGRISLIEDPNNYDCVFLKGKKCSVYNARPKQCSRFPWWKSTIETREGWEAAKSYCEGIDHPEGKLYSQEEIELLS